MLEAFGERVLAHDRVRIQKKHVLARRLANGLVVGHGKPHVVFVGDELHPRETATDHVHRAVDALVVHDPHFHGEPLGGPLHRHQTLLEERPNVVAHNHDTQVGHPL